MPDPAAHHLAVDVDAGQQTADPIVGTAALTGVPAAPPDALAGYVTPMRSDEQVVGWRLLPSSVMLLAEPSRVRDVVDQFIAWQATHVVRHGLGLSRHLQQLGTTAAAATGALRLPELLHVPPTTVAHVDEHDRLLAELAGVRDWLRSRDDLRGLHLQDRDADEVLWSAGAPAGPWTWARDQEAAVAVQADRLLLADTAGRTHSLRGWSYNGQLTATTDDGAQLQFDEDAPEARLLARVGGGANVVVRPTTLLRASSLLLARLRSLLEQGVEHDTNVVLARADDVLVAG